MLVLCRLLTHIKQIKIHEKQEAGIIKSIKDNWDGIDRRQQIPTAKCTRGGAGAKRASQGSAITLAQHLLRPAI